MSDSVEHVLNTERVFVESDYWDGKHVMHCACCGGANVHTIGAYTRVGDDENEAEVYDGTIARGTTWMRRSALVMAFLCEGGCRFALVIQQDKGENVVWVERLPAKPEYNAEKGEREEDDLAALWEKEGIEARIRLLKHQLANSRWGKRDAERRRKAAVASPRVCSEKREQP